MSPTKNYAVNCRCGKRNVFKVPVEVNAAVKEHAPLQIITCQSDMDPSKPAVLVAIHALVFKCSCDRMFELTRNGLRNITDDADTLDMMHSHGSGSTMVN